MPQYKVEFSREWLTGRWGFVDRVMTQAGAKATDESRLQHAWLINYKGSPQNLGRFLAQELNIQRKDFLAVGSVFNIVGLDPLPPPAPKPRGLENRLGERKAQIAKAEARLSRNKPR